MSARQLVLLFFALLAFHSLGNWSLPLIDRDEPRFSEASREMLQRADFIVPYFNNEVRFDKPPLIYWMQCASCRVFGVNEFAVRFPSAICAALAAVVIALWGARILDATSGWRAALIFSLSLQTLVHARASVADMPMVLAVVFAAWAGWEWKAAEADEAAPRRVWPWWAAFWLALAVGFLAKGPIAWLPLGMVWWGGLPRAAQPRHAALKWIGGAVLMLAVIALWGVPALLRTHGMFAEIGLGKHVIGRSIAPMEGHGSSGFTSFVVSLPFYFATVWLSFFPWSIWLPAAGRYYVQHRLERGNSKRYLLVGVVLCFGIFTLVRTKLPHYTLPCFPFLALMLAGWWRRAERSPVTFRRTVIITAGCGIALFLGGFPIAARQFPAEQLLREASPVLAPDMPLGAVEYQEPSLVWLFRSRINGFMEKLKPKDVAEWLAKPGARLTVIPTETLEKLNLSLDPSWPIFRANGFHPVKGRRVKLTLIVKPAEKS